MIFLGFSYDFLMVMLMFSFKKKEGFSKITKVIETQKNFCDFIKETIEQNVNKSGKKCKNFIN
jgi:uncharacterized protein Yka (UPF0111/DUF47 family)